MCAKCRYRECGIRAEADNPGTGFVADHMLLQPASAVRAEESRIPADCTELVAVPAVAVGREDHSQQWVEQHSRWERNQNEDNRAVRTESILDTDQEQSMEKTAAVAVGTTSPELAADCGTVVDHTVVHTDQPHTQDLADQQTDDHKDTLAVHNLADHVHCVN